MPRIGMEPLRRRALIDAAIDAIGERGSLDVTMAEIAGRAGVSPALAHHYFGAKEDLIFASMRHVLMELGRDLRNAISGLSGHERVRAIIQVNFSAKQFRPEVIAAWLTFYVEAQRASSLRRLLRVYARRLHSNLVFALRPLMPASEAERTAEGIAALIDGLYIRRALKDGPPDPQSAIALVEDYLFLQLRSSGDA
ncbi:transcriptional regulator BetI [Chelativorans sp. J32]|uniref:transcriptional regulator BetI n=1 Tax=Chelativorans sp. J32 TaxID=935840 RepID=UPI000487ABCF|nr:transcriptional regulator BetI [Chelativorans sp. J32]